MIIFLTRKSLMAAMMAFLFLVDFAQAAAAYPFFLSVFAQAATAHLEEADPMCLRSHVTLLWLSFGA